MKCASSWIIGNHENHDFSKTKGKPFVICLDLQGFVMESCDLCRFHWFHMHTAMIFQDPRSVKTWKFEETLHQTPLQLDMKSQDSCRIPISCAYSYFSKTKGEPYVFLSGPPGPCHGAMCLMIFQDPHSIKKSKISENLAPITPRTCHEVTGLMQDSNFMCI